MCGSDGLPLQTACLQIGQRGALDAVELRVTDASFRTVASGFGYLSAELPPGLYELETRAGRSAKREVLRLKAGDDIARPVSQIEFETPMPLSGTSSSRETYRDALSRLSRIYAQDPSATAGLVVFIRNMNRGAQQAISPALLQGWSVRNEQGRAIDLLQAIEVRASEQWMGLGVPLPAGGYVVEIPGVGTSGSACQSLWLAAGWTTGIFIANEAAGLSIDTASVQMIRLGQPWPFEDAEIHGVNRAAELAIAALRDGRSLLGKEALLDLLHRKFENPFLGIVGAHALLLDPEPDRRLLEEVVENLVRLAPGHPDVAALQFGCHMRFPQSGIKEPVAVSFPPLLQASMRLLLEADAGGVEAIKVGSTAERAAVSRVLRGVWTTWKPTEEAVAPGSADMIAKALRVTRASSIARAAGRALVRIAEDLEANESLAGALAGAVDPGEVEALLQKARSLAKFGVERDALLKVAAYAKAIMADPAVGDAVEALRTLDPHDLSRVLGLPLRPVARILELMRVDAPEEDSGEAASGAGA